jgi:crossover junction endodeoxyribonuclease RuvC
LAVKETKLQSKKERRKMNILAIDLGSRTGWAFGDMRTGTVRGGTESFAPAKNDPPGHRWIKFRAFLGDTGRAAGEIHAVYYEDVKRHEGVIAAHVYGGFLAFLQAWCATNNVPLHGVGVGEVKKHWTGKGNADKAAMIAEATCRGHVPIDDNHADALAILSLARAKESGEYVAPVKRKTPKKDKAKNYAALQALSDQAQELDLDRPIGAF